MDRENIQEWSKVVEAVAKISEYVPQIVFAGMKRALQHEWTFVQRVVPNVGPLFTKLKDTIFNLFYSKLFEEKIISHIRNIVSVTIR